MNDSLNNKGLVAVGHQFAKTLSSDTPIIDMAKMVTRLAERLDCTTAALREMTKQRDTLAAELSAVDAIHNDAVFITDDHYDQCPPEVQKIIRSLAVLQIPAHQAFLAEVRASGVEMLASLAGNECQRYKSVNDRSGARKWKGIVILCTDFAAQIRKGVQS